MSQDKLYFNIIEAFNKLNDKLKSYFLHIPYDKGADFVKEILKCDTAIIENIFSSQTLTCASKVACLKAGANEYWKINERLASYFLQIPYDTRADFFEKILKYDQAILDNIFSHITGHLFSCL